MTDLTTRGMVALLCALALGACTDRTASPQLRSDTRAEVIPQPRVMDLEVAPDADRVDLELPSFSEPTEITNPLFPVSRQGSVLLVGHVDGLPFRSEVTLLSETKIVEWQGMRVETAVSQYAAFLDGRITEIAYDYYAQDDKGSVWYFGEDVADFKDGAIVSTEGTWLAGKDGPAAMIMPAHPKVDDAYRTENAPGFAFEEVTVLSVGEKLKGPLGSVEGGITVNELHMDGQSEEKSFAPGYGEFVTSGDGDLEALALAVPTDSEPGPLPSALSTLESGAGRVLEFARAKRWSVVEREVGRMEGAWGSLDPATVPWRIRPLLGRSLRTLARSVETRRSRPVAQAAIDATHWILDLELRYRPTDEIDLARLDLWAAQSLVDASAHNLSAVTGDVFALDYIRDRLLAALGDTELAQINERVGQLQAAVIDGDLGVVARGALDLRDVVGSIE